MFDKNGIIEGMARALFVTWYADNQDERRRQGKRSNCAGPGQDWNDIAPKSPRDAFNAAWFLAGMYQHANGMGLYSLAGKAKAADCTDTINEFDFGWNLAMMALGHGISWFDDHEVFDLKSVYINPFRG